MRRSQQPGYWTIGRHPQLGDIDIHWSMPLGPLVLSHFNWMPGFWLGITLLVVLHEVGHALLARRYGMRVMAIRLHGFGGHCAYIGMPSAWQRSAVAWGGVMMQAPLLLLALTWYLALGPPRSPFLYQFQDSWMFYNGLLIALNLLPFEPLDGGQAWKLLPMARKRWRERRERAHLRVVTGGGKPSPLRGADPDPTPPPSQPITPEEYAKAEAQRLWQEALRQRNKHTDKRSMH
jgi:hypothetical protein